MRTGPTTAGAKPGRLYTKCILARLRRCVILIENQTKKSSTPKELNFKINVRSRIHWCASSAQKDNLSTRKLSKSKHLVVGQASARGGQVPPEADKFRHRRTSYAGGAQVQQRPDNGNGTFINLPFHTFSHTQPHAQTRLPMADRLSFPLPFIHLFIAELIQPF